MGKKFFSEVLILVAADPSYPDHDCGLTAPVLRKNFAGVKNVTVHEVRHGDLFCAVLNHGAGRLLRTRCDYMCVLSHGALSYLTELTLLKALEAFENEARVVGVAFEDLQESVLEGRVANTFAIWDLESLARVGLFDFRAAQPKIGDTQSPPGGVEEIIPLIRMVKIFGPCIAPIVPAVNHAHWVTPDPETDPEGHARHVKKMESKLARQTARARSEGENLAILESGVMK